MVKIDWNKVENKKTKTGWDCIIPSFRHDVKHETDLIEEVLRCYGYENIQKEIDLLRKQLQLVIQKEKYEEAAGIRDKIRLLENQ